jgi:hypothetical protein
MTREGLSCEQAQERLELIGARHRSNPQGVWLLLDNFGRVVSVAFGPSQIKHDR